MAKRIAPIPEQKIADTFDGYPLPVRAKLLIIRQLIIDTALEAEGVGRLEETLKWGEPAYLTKGGSTIRISQHKPSPEHYAIYFICSTNLIDTFQELYPETFTFEGNRAIVFHLNDKLPVNELKHCLSLVLSYHTRKKLTLLGA
ncbi:MAG: DUF1801 domain-containing protein [Pseudomonadales bacterium]|jgi:hypothetical protein